MGVAPALARGAVRVSLGRDTQAADVERFIEVLGHEVRALRGLAAVAV